MQISVCFDLGALSDRVLNLLLRGSGEANVPKTDLVRAIADVLTAELLARQQGRPWPARKEFSVESGLSPEDLPAIADAIHALVCDITELERAAELAPAGSLEREEITTAAAFLFSVGDSIAHLSRARGAA